MLKLRSYQVPGFDASMQFFKQETPDPGILVAPTAYGKSVLIAHNAYGVDGKTVIIQPSKELLRQNYEKYVRMGGYATIYSASAGEKRFGNIMYATIGSIKTLGRVFKERGFKNMMIDEIHMYPRGDEGMLGKFMDESGIKRVLGLTASPFKLQTNFDQSGERFSKLQMLTSRSKYGQFFKDIIHVTQIQQMVELGFWSKLQYELHDFDGSSLQYNSAKSDYTEESLRFTFESEDILSKVLTRVQTLDRKSVIIYVPTIAEAERLASHIPGARAIHSNLHEKDRDAIVDGFRAGKIRYVVNVNMLATGFDHPEVDCIISARPTASLAWFYQALGRGTRIHPDKKDCLIIDFAGNVHRFGKIEHIYFKKKKTWQCYGEGGRLLTGLAMDQIGTVFDAPANGVILPFGKHKGKDISQVPKDYLQWMLSDLSWNDNNMYLKEAAEKLVNQVV